MKAGAVLKRLGFMLLAMAVISAVAVLTYAYVVPYVVSGGLYLMTDAAGRVITGSYDWVNDLVGGRLASTTDTLLGGEPAWTDAARNMTPGGGTVRGSIARVIDGDTLVVGGKTLRLALVDAPERGEKGYSEAADFTRTECPMGTVAHYRPDYGQSGGSYGRVIAKVWCSGMSEKSLNELLVEARHAEILAGFCGKSEFSQDAWASGCR